MDERNSLIRHRVLFANRYYSSYGSEFQEFFEEIMDATDPDFSPVGLGAEGDWGADGIALASNTVYQVYAPPVSRSGWKKKALTDARRAVTKWGNRVNLWIFVYRHRESDPPPEMLECIESIQIETGIRVCYWGFLGIWNLVAKMDYTTRCGLLGDFPSSIDKVPVPNFLLTMDDIFAHKATEPVSKYITQENIEDGTIVWRESHVARILEQICYEDLTTKFASVVLLGPSGSGKTITAIQTGWKFSQEGWNVFYTDIESLEVTIESNLLGDYLRNVDTSTLVIMDNVNNSISETYLILNGLYQNLRGADTETNAVRILLTFRMERTLGNPLLRRLEMITSFSEVVSLKLNEDFAKVLARRSLTEERLKVLDIPTLLSKISDSIPRFEAAVLHFKDTGKISLDSLFELELERITSSFNQNPHLKTTAEIALKIISLFTRMHCMVSFVFLSWLLAETKLPRADYVLDQLFARGHLSLTTYGTETLLGVIHPEIADGLVSQNMTSLLSLFASRSLDELEKYVWTEYIRRASNDLPLFLISLCYSLWERSRPGFGLDILSELLKLPLSNPELSKGLCNLSLLLSSEGLYSETHKALDLALLLNPNDAHSWINLGALFATSGDSAKALESFEKAIQISPEMTVGYANIGIIKEGLGDTEGALRALQRAVELGTDEPYVWVWYGFVLVASGESEKAIDAYESAVMLAPQWTRAKILLSDALIRIGRKKDGLKMIVNISKDPNLDNDTLEMLAGLLSLLSRKSKALEFLKRAKEMNPSCTRYWHGIAILMQEFGESDKFIEEYKSKTSGLEGTSFDFASLAVILENFGVYDEVRELFLQAASRFDDETTPVPLCFMAYVALGMVDEANKLLCSQDADRNELEDIVCNATVLRFERGDIEEAQMMLNTLDDLLPNNPIVWRLKGDILSSKGDQSGAISAFEKAVEIEPNYSDAWISLGHRYLETHLGEEAYDAITKAIDTIKESPFPEYAWNTIGIFYLEAKMYLQAEEAFKKSIDINPDLAISRKNLGLLYLELDRKKDAEKQFEISKKLWPSMRGRPSSVKLTDILGARLPRMLRTY